MWARTLSFVFAALWYICAVVVAHAQAEKPLSGADEDRARNLFLELRCVVCQNQSIGDSDADVAKDLRIIVREQITEGKSNEQIKEFLVARYGEFILLKPIFAWHTALLWGGPIMILLIGGLLAVRSGRGNGGPVAQDALSPEEEKELAELLKQSDSKDV